MPGMPWDQQSQMSPQDMARFRLMMQIMGSRGTGGMQQNPLSGLGGQQGFMNPQTMALLQYYMAQQAQNQGGPGNYPQGGGAVTLPDLLTGQQSNGLPSLPSFWHLPSQLANEGLS